MEKKYPTTATAVALPWWSPWGSNTYTKYDLYSDFLWFHLHSSRRKQDLAKSPYPHRLNKTFVKWLHRYSNRFPLGILRVLKHKSLSTYWQALYGGGGGFLIYYLILTTSPQAGITALIVHMKKQVLWHTKSLPKVIQGCQSQESSIQTCDVLLSIFVTLDPSEMSQLIPSRKTQFLLCPIGVIALSLETFPVIYHRSWYNNHPAFRVWAARY